MSVAMAVRDGAPYVGAAVESVLSQSLGDLELLVVDDASTDGTAEVLDRVRDPRLVRFRNAEATGAAGARNRALLAARGEYVAVQDADDLSRADRLSAEVGFLERRPEVAACGSRFTTIDALGRPVATETPAPTSDALVAWRLLLFANPFAHSSTMLRREVLRRTGPYDASLAVAHDRELLSRVFRAGRLAVLGDELVVRRVHVDSLGAQQRPAQRANSLRVREGLLRWFLGDDAPCDAIRSWYDAPIPGEQVERLADLFLRTYTEVLQRFQPAPAELAELRADLAARLGSVRRRDGRIAEEYLTRAYWRSVLPGPVLRVLRRLRGRT